MEFYKVPKKESNPDGKRYAVYMKHLGMDHYVCDMVEGNTAEDAATNALGLTLRARLDRSQGKYAMLEGEIFNPDRLLRSACEITEYKREDFTGGEYHNGYSLLTITADGCTNKYMVFDSAKRNSLIKDIEAHKKSRR